MWYVDSGCSRHMAGDKSHLRNYREVNGPKVVFGGETSGQTRGIGDVQRNGLTIKDASYVEGLNSALVSFVTRDIRSNSPRINAALLVRRTKILFFQLEDERTCMLSYGIRRSQVFLW